MNQTVQQKASAPAPLGFGFVHDPEDQIFDMIWRDRWMPYTAGNKAIERMWWLLQQPPTIRPFSMLIVGDTNNGKTMIAHRFLREVEKWKSQDNSEKKNIPVVYVQTPPDGNLGTFYSMILRELSAPFPVSANAERKREIVFEQLRNLKTRILIVDEIHDVASAKKDKEDAFLKAIKFISNTLQISIVGIGTLEAMRVVQTDQQLGNRLEPFRIPRWKPDQELATFLSHLVQAMGIPNVDIFKRKQVIEKINFMSEEVIGEARKIVGLAVAETLESGKKEFDPNVFDKIDWTRPSDRRKLGNNKK